MRLWWLWAVLLALLAGIWMLRIGVRITLSQGIWTVTLRIGPCSIPLYPPKKEEQPEKAPQKEQPEPEPPSKPKFQLPKWDPGQIQSAVQALWPPLRRALDRTRRGIRIAPLRVHVVLGAAADPAEGARTYGLIQCGVWTFMPVLEQLLTVKDPQIHVGVDFQNEQTVAEGEAELSLRLGTGLRVAAGIAVPALRWFISMQRQAHRKKPETVKPAA